MRQFKMRPVGVSFEFNVKSLFFIPNVISSQQSAKHIQDQLTMITNGPNAINNRLIPIDRESYDRKFPAAI